MYLSVVLFCCWTVGGPTVQKKLSWTHLLGKRKGIRVYRNAVNVGHVEVVLFAGY